MFAFHPAVILFVSSPSANPQLSSAIAILHFALLSAEVCLYEGGLIFALLIDSTDIRGEFPTRFIRKTRSALGGREKPPGRWGKKKSPPIKIGGLQKSKYDIRTTNYEIRTTVCLFSLSRV
jgi:hypothetical protein